MPTESHNRAAEHHESAAKFHRNAAESHGRGDHEQGFQQSTQAQNIPHAPIRALTTLMSVRR